MIIRKKNFLLGMSVALCSLNSVAHNTVSTSYQDSNEAYWKDLAGYCGVILASAGMGALSGYYDAVHLGCKYDTMVQEINDASYSKEMFEKATQRMIQGSYSNYGKAYTTSCLQWLASWYARRSLVIGLRQDSQRSWVKESLGAMSFLATWTAWIITYSLLRKTPAVINTNNFNQWKK